MRLHIFCCVPVLCLVVSISTPANDPAATLRGDPAHTGVYAGAGVPTVIGVKWRFRTTGFVFSSPASAGGVAYVGSTDGKLYAVDLQAGTEEWKFKSGARITASPAVDSG